MNKPLIKVFKRRTEVAIQTQKEPEVFDSSLKAAHLVRREIVNTIGGWIDERREQNRLAEIIARQMISGELLTGKG
ncbi:MAG: hypothetical protein ABI954_03410 [Pyrinomonadaceae bacterium]